jgi:hypothetical protein
MGALKDIVTAIEDKMVALGFKKTKDVFDFEHVPDSVINKAFRIEARTVENRYYSGNVGNPKDEISLWIAYKLHRDPLAAWKAALDDQEAIERALINDAALRALPSDPLLMMDREQSTQKYLENFLISKLAFTADYLRDISPI